MNMKKMLVCGMAIFALVLSSGSARSLEKRSPQEDGAEEGGSDPCVAPNAWQNFFSFKTWCVDGIVGAKPPAIAEEGA